MMKFGIPPKCPPRRGFRSWREGLANILGGAVWAGSAVLIYEEVVDGRLVSDPSRGLVLVYWVLIWSPLLVASFIWQRWGRAAFPLEESANDPSK